MLVFPFRQRSRKICIQWYLNHTNWTNRTLNLPTVIVYINNIFNCDGATTQLDTKSQLMTKS